MFTGITRSTGITSHGHLGTLATAILVLTGAAILRGGAAAADPNQDDQFLALLDQEGIPALEGVPYLIDTAHKVCRAVDAGFSADAVVDAMVQFAYSQDPAERNYAPGRLARTEARFVTASVEAYCPYDRGKIASLAVNPASAWNVPTAPGTAHAHTAVAVTTPAQWRGVVAAGRFRNPAGDITQPQPPEIPMPPPPPVAHLQTPPRPIAAPPRPRQAPPRPQQPAPAPLQPAPAPQQPAPAPLEPPPAPQQPAPPPPPPPPPAPPPMSPGFVRLAP